LILRFIAKGDFAMSSEQNKALVKRFVEEIFNKGDLSKIPEVIAPNWVNIDPAVPPMSGLEGARQLVGMFRTGFPDFHMVVDEMIADENAVAINFNVNGTNTGEMMGMPPTGKKIKVYGAGILRVANGKIVQNHVVFDKYGLLEQLGVIPVQTQAGK
jgi:steroid delta-isomerase-like uncharacterized protein